MIDVTGFPLGEAFQLLKDAGIADIRVKLTAAPRKAGKDYSLQSRVVRQNALSTTTQELVVCNFDLPD